ncbi:hypothetical protein B5X24_HaOG206151 [Helicoverpa armigera]|nr:hypothetical protein B5X24_HaOG206151 [Helicoverpa armigera]
MRLSPTLSARGCERRRGGSTAHHRHHTRSPGERAHDARRPPGGSLKSHPVVGVALTPRYSPRPRLDNVRPAAAPPEEPAEPDPEPSSTAEPPEPPAPLRLAVSAAPAGPT